MHNPDLGELLIALRRKLVKSSRNFPLRSELSAAQFEALWYIALAGSSTMDALSKRLGIRPSSTTELIASLEKKHLVARSQSQTDRRIINVSLTPIAKRRVTALKRKSEQAFIAMLSTLSVAEQQELSRILSKLVATPNLPNNQ